MWRHEEHATAVPHPGLQLSRAAEPTWCPSDSCQCLPKLKLHLLVPAKASNGASLQSRISHKTQPAHPGTSGISKLNQLNHGL
jgi:hypothetical protein